MIHLFIEVVIYNLYFYLVNYQIICLCHIKYTHISPRILPEFQYKNAITNNLYYRIGLTEAWGANHRSQGSFNKFL